MVIPVFEAVHVLWDAVGRKNITCSCNISRGAIKHLNPKLGEYIVELYITMEFIILFGSPLGLSRGCAHILKIMCSEHDESSILLAGRSFLCFEIVAMRMLLRTNGI